MYEWLIMGLAGWFGSYWWGQERGAPNPKDPHPWEHILVGLVAGVAAIAVVRITAMNSEPMPGMVLAIATGCVVARVVGGLIGGMRAKG